VKKMGVNMRPGGYSDECRRSCRPRYDSCHYGSETPEIIEYIIQPGDTLNDLAYRYNTTVEDIMEYNPGIDPYNLRIGQVVLIPDPPFGWGMGPWYGFGYGPWYGFGYRPWYGFGPIGPWI
jgi:phage tail protein X